MPWMERRFAILLLWCCGSHAGRWVEVDFSFEGGGGDGGPGGPSGPDGPGGGSYSYGGYNPGSGGYGGFDSTTVSPRSGTEWSERSSRSLKPSESARSHSPRSGDFSLSWNAPALQHTIIFDEVAQQAIAFGGETPLGVVTSRIAAFNVSSRKVRLSLPDFSPIAREGHSAVFDPMGRKMWVYGGKGSDNQDLGGLWSLDVETLQWSLSNSDSPADQSGHSAVWDARTNRMYIFGPVLKNVWYYDKKGDVWRKAEPATNMGQPQKRQEHTAVWDPSTQQMWLYGGRVKSSTFGDLWAFATEGDNFQWTQSLETGPSARSGHNAAWDEGRQGMWMFAGIDADSTVLQDLWFHSPQASTWELVPDPPPPSRYQAGSVFANGEFWIHGGREATDQALTDFWYYEPGSEDTAGSAVPFNVTSGDCVAVGPCVKSPNYPLPYTAGSCTITSWPGMKIYALQFQTQDAEHTLNISGKAYSQSSWPVDTVPEGEIIWTAAEAGGFRDAWLLCAYDFTVNSGGCTLAVDGCVRSPNFPDKYNSQSCEITPRPGLEITSAFFQTESSWDRLRVNGYGYSGSTGPSGIIANGQTIEWIPDQVGFREGWELCGSSIFSVLEGNCTADANCIYSPHYNQSYGNEENCIIAASGAISVRSEVFDTEEGRDVLLVGNKPFSGTQGPEDVVVEGPILWHTDWTGTRSGWKVCRAPFTLISGNCNITSRDCVSSPNYPAEYESNDACSIMPRRGMTVAAVDFQTESLYDYLTVESIRYSGDTSPQSIEVNQQISWFSSASIESTGWLLCRVCQTSEAPGDCACQRGYEIVDGQCQFCRPGTVKGNVSFQPCQPCPGGTRARSDALGCTECGLGNFSEPGASACSLCPPGRFASAARSSECTQCPQGTYGFLEGATESNACQPCPRGSTTLGSGYSSRNDCITVERDQQHFCTAGRPCVISDLKGSQLQNGHLIAITEELDCSAQKVPVPNIANSGVSREAEENGTRYQWGLESGDFEPVGGVYSLCFCANTGSIRCSNLNEGFLLSAGKLQVSGPVPSGEFHCIRGEPCRIGLVRGFGFAAGDRFGAQRAKCGSGGSLDLINAETTSCTGCANSSQPAVFGDEATLRLDLGIFLADPEAYGYYLCWCSSRESDCQAPSDFNVQAGRIRVDGPYTNQELNCASGQKCELSLIQGLGLGDGDRVMILAACGMGNRLLTFPGAGTLELGSLGFQFLTDGDAALLAEPGIYRVCYCRPGRDIACTAPAHFRASLGLMTVRGPLASTFSCWIGDECIVEVDGLELEVGDQVSLALHCRTGGDVNSFGLSSAGVPLQLAEHGGDAFEADLGFLEDNVMPGVYELCWCPTDGACENRAMRAPAGSVLIMCPPGYFAIGGDAGRRCVLCPMGFYCPGGLPAEARSIPCPSHQSTGTTGRAGLDACMCDVGYFKLEVARGCQVCPLGSYKDVVEDHIECQDCPDGETTYQTGSVDSSACFRSSGVVLDSATVAAAVFRVQLSQEEDDDLTREDVGDEIVRVEEIITNVAGSVSGSAPSSVDVVEVGARRLQNANSEAADPDVYTGSLFEVTVRHRSGTAVEAFMSAFNAEAMELEIQKELENDPDLDLPLVASLATQPRREDVVVTCEDGTSTAPGRLVLSPADCECSPGFGWNAQLRICQPCPLGAYKASVGNSLCQQCPESRTTPDLGATSSEQCLCQAGLYVVSVAGVETCEPCPQNFYCTSRTEPQACRNNSVTTRPGARTDAECTCMPGHYLATVAELNTCDACPSGRYKPNIGDEPCVQNCPANSDSLVGATSARDCFCKVGYHAVEDTNTSQLEMCLACNYRGLTCPGGRDNVTGAHIVPLAVQGFYQTGSVVAVACDVKMEDGSSACQGGNVCAAGSTGRLCGECPQRFARDQYPNYCRACPDDSSLWLGMVILLDLFQKTFFNFVVAAMAATSAIKDSDSLHTSMIRIGTQWMTACSVISHFSIDQLAVFSWTQEAAELEHKQTCADSGSCAEAVEVVTYSWPDEVTEWFRQAFSFLDVVSKLTSVSFMSHCYADALNQADRVALLAAPGVYFLSLPALAVLNTFLLCALIVYLILPCLHRHGWEFNEAGKKRQKREKAISQLKDAIAASLEVYGLTFDDVEATGVLTTLALPSLQHGVEEPEPFVAGILELSAPLSIRACLLQVGDEAIFVSMREDLNLSWDECVENATLLTTGINRASLTKALRTQNARSDHDLLSDLVKRAFVWKRRDQVEAIAEGADVQKLAVSVATSNTLKSLAAAAANPETFDALVVAQRDRMRMQAESDGDTIFAASEEEEHKLVDLETLDLGLFTKFPRASQLFHQCIPVIWVTLINMWPELLSKYLQMIWCKPLSEEGGVKQRLQPHPDIECWVGDHVPIAIIAIVGLSVWCIGIPLLLYLSIWRLKDRNTQENYRMYGYFIDGFEPAFWWWDILVKRADVAIMMLVTYTSVADDEKAKLLIYPFVSGGQLALTAWCRPFLNNQAEILDFLEYILSSFRFLFFSGIALLLIFHSQDTLWALAGILAAMLFLMCFYFLVHVVAQAVRKASKDMEEEEEEATANVFRRQISNPSKSVNTAAVVAAAHKERVAASGCTGRIKHWVVDHVLPLIQESGDEKYMMEWCVESDYVSLVTAEPPIKRSKINDFMRKIRAWLLRFGSSFQRRVVAKALQEFATLWLELFQQNGLPTKTLKVLCALTTAKSHVPAKTPKKDVPLLWKNQVKVILSYSAPEEEGPRMYRFSPDDLMRTTQRLGLLEVEDAVELVNNVVELLRMEHARRPSVHFVPPQESMPAREATDASFNMEHLNLLVAGEGGMSPAGSRHAGDLKLEKDHIGC